MTDPRIKGPAVVRLPSQGAPTAGAVALSADVSLTAQDVETLWKDVYAAAHRPQLSGLGKTYPQYMLWLDLHSRLVAPFLPDQLLWVSERAKKTIYLLTDLRPHIPQITGILRYGQSYDPSSGSRYVLELLQYHGGNWSASFRFQRVNPSTDEIVSKISQMTLDQIFQAERRFLESPKPDSFPKMYGAIDVLCHLQIWIDFVPSTEWDKPWNNFRGEMLTFSGVMDAATASYIDQKVKVDHFDHGDFQMPQLLLRYHTKRGNNGMLRQIQQAFLNRELAGTIGKIYSVNGVFVIKAFHYVETLGTMLDHPGLKWEKEDVSRVKAWLVQFRKFVKNIQYDGRETAHYYRGMQLIAKNAAKIFP